MATPEDELRPEDFAKAFDEGAPAETVPARPRLRRPSDGDGAGLLIQQGAPSSVRINHLSVQGAGLKVSSDVRVKVSG